MFLFSDTWYLTNVIFHTVHNVGYARAIGAVSVINHFYGRDDIALGAFKGQFGDYVSGDLQYLLEIQTRLYPKVRNHGEGPY